jgi:hypothetical protein
VFLTREAHGATLLAVTRSLQRSLLSFAVVATFGSIAACAGPPVSSAITGEPVCADYSIGTGGAKFKGGLQFPVRVTILDGDDPITKVLIYGKRNETDPNPKLILPDKNAEYKVEWAQCANERVTAAVTATKSKSLRNDSVTSYDCGEAKAYKTGTLSTKKGEPASHALTYEAPPEGTCWKDEKPDAVVADAGAPDAAPAAETQDAGAADAEAPDGGAADAEAPDAAPPAAAPAKEGGDKPAEKKEEKAPEKPAPEKPGEIRAPTPDR